jgi:BirA family biotin operon repressor/biotin-[acetyl-CoA-carboxylase] ligase
VKWPNDVLVAGRKAAGVLVEADPRRFFVGVGANVSAAPSRGAGGGDAQLGGTEIEPGCFGPSIGLYTFAERFEAVLAELLHGPEWWSVLQRRLAWRSQRVEVDSGDWKSVETRSGVVRGVAEDGALILEHDGRELRVHSGTIRQPEGSKSVDGAGDLFRG